MNQANAARLNRTLPADAKVLDVGGGASPFPRADYVIDALPYDGRGALGEVLPGVLPRYTPETWVQWDVCRREPWPFPDGYFDFATCSHLLEDVRDPLWICSELQRVAKAGYIETPSRLLEQTRGVEHPLYCGYYHHRWLVSHRNGCLEFRNKPHNLHTLPNAWVVTLGPSQRLCEGPSIVVVEWESQLLCVEVLEFDEDKAIAELCEFAAEARKVTDVIVPIQRDGFAGLRRWIYWQRLKWGSR